MIQLPLVGGFNDGKFIDPNGRNKIKMGKPSSYNSSISHVEENIGFEYEIYELVTIPIHGRHTVKLFAIEGITLPEIYEKLVSGYKQYNKRKTLDLAKK